MGAFTGSIIGGALAGIFGYKPTFLIAAFAVLVSFVLALRLKETNKSDWTLLILRVEAGGGRLEGGGGKLMRYGGGWRLEVDGWNCECSGIRPRIENKKFDKII